MRPRAASLAVALVLAVVLIPNLGGYALLDPDEGRHAEIAREMHEARTWRAWVVPSLGGEPYYDKPVLFYWVTATAYRAFGTSERSARLASVLAAIATTFLVLRLGLRLWDAETGVASAAVLATSIGFVALGRLATLDMLLTCWITASLGAFADWLATGRRTAIALAAAAAALGMLTKGLVAPVLVGATALATLALRGELRRLDGRTILVAALVFLAVAAPWHVAAAVADPEYLRTFFVRHHLRRLAGDTVRSHVAPFYYYVPVLALGLLPWTLVLPSALATVLRRDARDGGVVFCATWAAVVIGLFSLSRDKLPPYVLPALPALAVLTGRFVVVLRQRPLDVAGRPFLWLGTVVAALACAAAGVVAPRLAADAYEGAYAPIAPLAWLLPPFGIALALAASRRRWSVVPPLRAGLVAVMAPVVYLRLAPLVGRVRSTKVIAETIARAGVPADTALVAYGARAPSLLFYARRPVILTDRPRDVRALRATHPLVLVVTTAAHVERLAASGPWWAWQTGPRVRLLGSTPPPVSLTLGPAAR